MIPEVAIEPLTILTNNSIMKGLFPDELKIARFSPIYKSGDPSQPSI